MTTRRSALLNLAGLNLGVAALSTLPILGQNPPPENHHSTQPVTKQEAEKYRFVYFQPEQSKTLDALTETIIPADEHSRGAKAARVSEYIDVIVADSAGSIKTMWKDGIESIDRVANAQFGSRYWQCAADQQIALLTKIAANEGHPTTPEEHFFAALKRAAIDGYYTSRIGIYDELQYHGNEALPSYPACSQPA